MDRNIQDVEVGENFDRTMKTLQFAGFFFRGFAMLLGDLHYILWDLHDFYVFK